MKRFDTMSCSALDSVSMTAAAVNIRIFSGKTGFAALQPEWAELASASAYHFLHYPTWYGAELANRENTDAIFFVAFYEAGRLFAVMPFERALLGKGRLRVPVLQLFYPNEMGVNDVISNRVLAPYRTLLVNTLRRELPFFCLIRWQCVLENGRAVSLLPPSEKTSRYPCVKIHRFFARVQHILEWIQQQIPQRTAEKRAQSRGAGRIASGVRNCGGRIATSLR
ncbi:MAG: hypothetical protein NVV73_16855 [Cellvibrionaceae bacterium]|nr:hypothetical protein [Cellvibrionaceae bacterium]